MIFQTYNHTATGKTCEFTLALAAGHPHNPALKHAAATCGQKETCISFFQEIKPNANVKHYNETHNLDENDSVSMIAHHVLYLQTMTCQIDKDLSSSQMGAMKPPMQIFEPLCESKEVVQNMFPKNEGVFAALASQSVASPESRQKKKTSEHPGWLETHHTSLV